MARLGGDEFGILLPTPRRRRRARGRASPAARSSSARSRWRGSRSTSSGSRRDRDLSLAEPGRGVAPAASGRGDVRRQGRRAVASSSTRRDGRPQPEQPHARDAGPSGARDGARWSCSTSPRFGSRMAAWPAPRRCPVGAPRARAGPAGRVHPARGEDRPAAAADRSTSWTGSARTGGRGRTRAWSSPWRSTSRRGACSTCSSPTRSRRSWNDGRCRPRSCSSSSPRTSWWPTPVAPTR